MEKGTYKKPHSFGCLVHGGKKDANVEWKGVIQAGWQLNQNGGVQIALENAEAHDNEPGYFFRALGQP